MRTIIAEERLHKRQIIRDYMFIFFKRKTRFIKDNYDKNEDTKYDKN